MTALAATPMRRSPGPPRSGRSRRRGLLAAGAVASLLLLAAGLYIGRTTAPDAPVDGAPAGPGPTRLVEGVAVGYARSQQGAVAAAANYTTVLGDKRNLDPGFGQRVYPVFALPDVVDELLQRSRDFAARHGGATGLAADPRLVLRAAPVGYRLERYTPDEAVIAVWAVVAAAGTAELPLATTWGTEQLTLRWVDEDWRIAAITRASGPTPPQHGTDPVPANLADEVAAFEPFVYLPGGER